VGNGVWIFSAVASVGALESIVESASRTGAGACGTHRHTDRGDPRFAIGQNDLKRGQRGYDAGKKIKGRKRHIAVDTQGWLLAVIVHSAAIQDRAGARAVLTRLFATFSTLTTVFVDGGYTGKLLDWAKQMFGWTVQVVKRTDAHRFVVLPKRWIVERTFAWLNHFRRLTKDHEILPQSSETFVMIAMIHLALRRMA
jgi:transposase